MWPAGLIAVGVASVAHARGGNRRGGGVLLILVGGWLLLNTLDIIDASMLELFWPLVLIVAGTSLILQSMRRRRHSASDANDVVSSFAVMSGVKRTSTAARFRHAELTSLMGGCDLDLSQAMIPPGEEATIAVFAFMGGLHIEN